jgi:hypothetical protein
MSKDTRNVGLAILAALLLVITVAAVPRLLLEKTF